MRTLVAYSCAFFIFLGCSASAQSKTDLDIGGVKIKFVVPDGFCTLDESNPAEQAYINESIAHAKPSTDVLSLFWDCKALTAWRNRETVFTFEPDMASYATVGQYRNKTVADQIIPQMCTNFRATTKAFLDKASKTHLPSNVTSSSTPYGKDGVLHEDAKTCYTAVLSNIHLGKDSATKLAVNAITVIHGKIVVYGRVTDFTDESIVPVLLTKMQSTVAELQRSNE